MGLDSVELLVEVEKTFDIEILDSEAAEILTVGDFYNVVWSRIKHRKSNKCMSAMLFYRLRQYFIENYRIAKNDVQLNCGIDNFIEKENRRWIIRSNPCHSFR